MAQSAVGNGKGSVDLSVVVCTYNARSETLAIIDRLLLPSLAANADAAMELVFVDDASPLKDETLACFRQREELLKSRFGRVVADFRAENLGFARGYNEAAKLATGRVLLIANSDLYFPRGSIRHLAATLESSDRYGIAGPVSNDCYSPQKVAILGKLKDYSPESLEQIERFAECVHDAGRGPIAADYLSGFCFAIRRETAERFGLFDERFARAYFEDYDLCYRVRGELQLVIESGTYVHHGGVAGGSSSLWQQYSPLWNTRRFLGNGLVFAERHGYWTWIRQVVRQNCAYHLKRCNLTPLYENAWHARERRG